MSSSSSELVSQEMDVDADIELENMNGAMNNLDIENLEEQSENFNIDKILSYDNQTKLYTIQWEDGNITQEPKDNISFHAIETFNIIESHNQTLVDGGNMGEQQNAYVMLRSSVKKDSSIETQRMNTLDFCKQHNLKIDYYTEDNGVSGRFNEKTQKMNNLNYEFGYRLNRMSNGAVLVVNSIDRIGRHSKTILKIIDDLMIKNCSLAVVDIGFIITSKLYQLRSTKMIIYEHALKAQELSDEISRRVLKAIAQRKAKGISIPQRKITSFGTTLKDKVIIKRVITKFKSLSCDTPSLYARIPKHITQVLIKSAKTANINATRIKFIIRKFKDGIYKSIEDGEVIEPNNELAIVPVVPKQQILKPKFNLEEFLEEIKKKIDSEDDTINPVYEV